MSACSPKSCNAAPPCRSSKRTTRPRSKPTMSTSFRPTARWRSSMACCNSRCRKWCVASACRSMPFCVHWPKIRPSAPSASSSPARPPTARWGCGPFSAAAASAWCRNRPPPSMTACRAAPSTPATPPTSWLWKTCRPCCWKWSDRVLTGRMWNPSSRGRSTAASAKFCCSCEPAPGMTSRITRRARLVVASNAAWRCTTSRTKRPMRAF